jgi:cell division protein FtsL
MTTSEKINQLQTELLKLRKWVQSNEAAIKSQRQSMGDLKRQIEQYQSFIPTWNKSTEL